MILSFEWTLGILAGGLQALGYVFYMYKIREGEIDANPLTWLMFAYGTTLLLFLEWDREAHWTILILPVVCTIMSIYIAVRRLWQVRTRHNLRAGRADWLSFALDISLTIAYLSAWGLLISGHIVEVQRQIVVLFILFTWNAGVATSFFPLWKQAWNDPNSEEPLPWAIWTAAYAVLAVLTVNEYGWWTALLLYPVVNAVAHAAVSFIVLFRPRHTAKELGRAPL